MIQKVIKVGNSLAVTIPNDFALKTGWKAGKKVFVDVDPDEKTLIILEENASKKVLTPEFKDWLDTFNKKYKNVLTILAKK